MTSDLILNEFAVVMKRPKFKVSNDKLQRTILALKRTADVVNVKTKLKVVKKDPKDDMVIETAIDGCADIIVTGDNHLLLVDTFRDIRILTVEKMIECLSTTSP